MIFKTPVIYLKIIILLLISFVAKADTDLKSANNISITPFTGYRHDVFQWSIPRETSNSDDKLSELTWANHIIETGVKVKTEPKDKEFNLLGELKYGVILNKSTVQDSDWDNIGEFSRSFSNTKGNIFDLSGAIGFSQKLSNALITYYLGMDYTKYQTKNYGLNFKINRFRYTNINDKLGQTHPKSLLVAKYNFDNYAPWIGASIDYSIDDKFSVIPTAKAYLFYLSAEADWVLQNTRKHNPSFKHKAFGLGVSLDTVLSYNYSDNVDVYANLGIKILNMLKGTEKSFCSCDLNHTYSRDLKKLSFMSSSISLGIKYKL